LLEDTFYSAAKMLKFKFREGTISPHGMCFAQRLNMLEKIISFRVIQLLFLSDARQPNSDNFRIVLLETASNLNEHFSFAKDIPTPYFV
jgi:hypothetical protein